MNHEIGMLIRKMIEAAGLTQVEIARRLKVNQVNVNQWATGAREPRASILLRIAAECGFKLQRVRKRKG